MRKRRLISAMLAAVVFSGLPLFTASKPNVILIMSDDTGFEVFACYGSKEYSTPRFDKLAETGMRFNHCYA